MPASERARIVSRMGLTRWRGPRPTPPMWPQIGDVWEVGGKKGLTHRVREIRRRAGGPGER